MDVQPPTLSPKPERPRTPAYHYAEADRLLRRAQELSEEYSKTDIQAIALETDLQGMGRLLTDRATAHAALAQAPAVIANEARAYPQNQNQSA